MPIEAVIEEKDKDFSIYEVPLSLVDNGLDELIVESLGLSAGQLEPGRLARPAAPAAQSASTKSRSPWWANMPSTATPTSRSTRRSTMPASPIGPRSASSASRAKLVEREGPERLLGGYDGLLVPGGFGERGIEGKVEAIRFARERRIPFFGICLGMQCAVIEFARNVIGPGRAHSTEFNKDTPASGDLPAGRAAIDHRQGRHDAAGGPAGQARLRQQGGRAATAAERFPSGTAIATSSTTSIASSSPPTACRSPAPARTARWSK